MPAANGGCAEQECRELKFGQEGLDEPPTPLREVLRMWFIRTAALWLVIGLLLFGLFNLFAPPQ